LVITTTTLPSGTIGIPYTASILSTGGTSPISWSITSGQLPAGLSLNAASGAIAGTPSTAGSYSLTVKATDAGSPQLTASQTLNCNIGSTVSSTDQYGGVTALKSPNGGT